MRLTSSRLLTFALALLLVALLSPPPVSAGVDGYADLHAHLMAEHAFGGGWFWGTNEGPMWWAVRRCHGNFPVKDHGATWLPFIDEALGADTGWHLGKRNGYDNRRCRRIRIFGTVITIPGTCPDDHFKSWPRWDSIAHQQMWLGWMQDAWRGGLRLQVVSLDESRFLCSMTVLRSRRYGCDEMESIRRQARLLHNYAARNASWVAVAGSPEHARAIIASGRLALVMAVESTELFPEGDYRQQLDDLYGLGIRSMQLVHHADNRFAGAAPFTKLAWIARNVEEQFFGWPGTRIDDMVCGDHLAWVPPGCDGLLYLNPNGMTKEGIDLAQAMMDRGMLVDAAHLSRRSLRDLYDLAITRGRYPLFYSHVHMWDQIKEHVTVGGPFNWLKRYKNEKYLLKEEIPYIVDTKGMIGLRTGGEEAFEYGSPAPVANRCEGSSRSFAQSLMYAVDNKLTVGFGTDLNGFMEQMKGRYRRDAASCQQDVNEINASGRPANWFQHAGMGQIGLLPMLMSDLVDIGTPQQYIDHLNHSAEAFLQMWERARRIGGANLARDASASATSTYCTVPPPVLMCAIPQHVNDGNRSTGSELESGWRSAVPEALPQSVVLNWAGAVTIGRVVLYTATDRAMRDFDIQIAQGGLGNWTTIASVTGNTQAGPLTFIVSPPTTTSALRVVGKRGPPIEPNEVRVNEIEVYGP